MSTNNKSSSGVDITPNAVIFATAVSHNPGLDEIQLNTIPLSLNDNQNEHSTSDINDALKLLRKLPEAKSKNITIAPSNSQFQYHSFRLANMPESEISNAVHWKIAQETSSDPAGYKSDYFNVGTLKEGDQNKLELVGMCVKQSDLLSLVNQYESNGWFVSAIDSPIAALVRGLQRLTPSLNSGEPQLIINLERETTQLIISLNSQIHFYKTLRTGADRLISSLVRQYKITYQKAIPVFNALNLHQDLVNTIDQWHVSFPPQSEVEEVIANATTEYLNNLTQELNLCLQHIRKSHPQLIPNQFTALGLGATSAVIETLAEQFEFKHNECLIPPELSSQLQSKQVMGVNRASQLAIALGLATYFSQSFEQRRTA